MIAYLEGKVRTVREGWMVVQTGGVGYKVFPVGVHPVAGEEVALHILDYIREDRRELFGFADEDVRDLFEQLIDISGVGPKLAQKVLSVGSKQRIVDSILAGDVEMLTQLPGVGKKTAQKIILELQGVLVVPIGEGQDETLDALKSLGYSDKDIRDILPQLSADSVENRVREALRLLSS